MNVSWNRDQLSRLIDTVELREITARYKQLVVRHQQQRPDEPAVHFTIYTDSLEALKDITRTTQVGTLTRKIKDHPGSQRLAAG